MKIPRAPRLGLSLLFLGLLASCAVDKAALARDIDLRDVDLSTVSDGTCEAACTIDPPVMAANTSVRVKVAVVGCSCRSIEIVEPAALAGDKGFAAMLDAVRGTGQLSPDAVTAATVTSAALLKAVELAVSGRGN